MKGTVERRSAAELREAFDAAFAVAADLRPAIRARLLGVGVGGIAYAIPLEEVAGVLQCATVTPLPSPSRALLGLAATRGTLVALYDLGALLGHPARTAPAPMTAFQCARDRRVGLVFDHLDGLIDVDPAAIVASDDASFVSRVALGEPRRGVVDVVALLAALGPSVGVT